MQIFMRKTKQVSPLTIATTGRWINLWWEAPFAEDVLDEFGQEECSFGGGLGEYWSKVFVGNLTLNLVILVSLFVLHMVLISAVEAYWVSKVGLGIAF